MCTITCKSITIRYLKQGLLLTLLCFVIVTTKPPFAFADEPMVSLIPFFGHDMSAIHLEVKHETMEGGYLYLYWDDYPLFQAVEQNILNRTDEVCFDLSFDIPQQSPYSDPGDHSIHLEIYYQEPVEIPKEHLESREFIDVLPFIVMGPDGEALPSYEQLIQDYESLANQYASVKSEYDELEVKHNELAFRLMQSDDDRTELMSELEQMQGQERPIFPVIMSPYIPLTIMTFILLAIYLWKR